MVLVRLLVLSLFHVVGSQPNQSSQQAPSPPHPAGEQPPLGTGNLSFPWSRLRLPRYPSHCFCFIPTYRKLTRKSANLCFLVANSKNNTYFCVSGTSFLFTIASSCTPTSQVSASLAQCRSRLMSRTTQTGLYYTARVYRSPRPPYWTRTSLICLTR